MNKQRQYVFFLGHSFALAKKEIICLLEQEKIGYQEFLATDKLFGIEVKKTLPVDEWQKRLGGTVKIGAVAAEFFKDEVLEKIQEYLIGVAEKSSESSAVRSPGQPIVGSIKSDKSNRGTKDGKFKFSLNSYGAIGSDKILALGLKIKKALQAKGKSVRLVTSKTDQLSTVAVVKEGLLKTGADLTITAVGSELYLIKTIAVQDFADYSFKDYARPSIDSKSGMLPPKLAKLLLNLVGLNKEHVFLDPFCGSGTVLQEALLLGAKEIIGSDISPVAIKDSKSNLAWLKENYQDLIWPKVTLLISSAQELTKHLAENSVDRIAFEGYLGPSITLNVKQAENVSLELKNLYNVVFKELAKILKTGGKGIAVLPIINKQPIFDLNAFKISGLVQIKLAANPRGSLIYAREGQRVEREIFLFTKV